jgi:hypothetical protein
MLDSVATKKTRAMALRQHRINLSLFLHHKQTDTERVGCVYYRNL